MNGLTYRPNFLTSRQEQTFLRYADESFWQRDNSLVQNFGFNYERGKERVDSNDATTPLPKWAEKVASYLTENQLSTSLPNQMTIVNLEPGQGLLPFVESKISIDNSINILTLGAPIVINFFATGSGSEQRKAMLDTGSILSISGEARFYFAYGITESNVNAWKGKEQKRGRTVLMIFRHVFEDFKQIDDELIFEMRAQGAILNSMVVNSKEP